MRIKNLTENEVQRLNIRSYTGFDEYVLLDLPGGEPSRYYRGASHEYLDIPEAVVWNRFISENYRPDVSKKVLLLHQCSWAKPYDMSHVLAPLVRMCDAFSFVHRMVVSNVGVIPAELQMNSLFCSYDWVPLMGAESQDVTREFHQRFKEHLGRYLASNHKDYWAIVAVANRSKGSKSYIIQECAEQYGLPFFVAPDVKAWEAVTKESYRDIGERVSHPLVIASVKAVLQNIELKMRELGLLSE